MTMNTRDALIESAVQAARQRGYFGFSFADLAEEVGIRKASIHHHFPTKEDLAVAAVEAYTSRFAARLERIQADDGGRRAQLDHYAGLYREGLVRNQACLCGVLASEIAALPERVQQAVRQFFDLNLSWLEGVVGGNEGQQRAGKDDSKRAARVLLSALQGAMFVALSAGDRGVFDDAAQGAIAMVVRD